MIGSASSGSGVHKGVILNRIAGWLAPHEYRIIETICDTFFPSLSSPADSAAPLALYYQRSAQDLHLPMLIAETLRQENREAREELHQLLAVFASPLSSLLLVGRAQPFSSLSLEWREKYLLALAYSPLPQLRKGFQALKRLCCFLYFAIPDEQGLNPNGEALDYVPPPALSVTVPRPIQPLAVRDGSELECDVVVIGSGAGGGVVAGELALAGKDVIVLEKGGYFNENDFSWPEARGTSELYLKRGLLATRDLGIIIFAGSALGGGTVVNWTTSLRARPAILEEWAHCSGLSLFTDAALQESYTAVERRIQVNQQNSAHNRQNQVLFDGTRALGYHTAAIPRNVIGCEQRCGACGYGCRYGCKQSTLKTYVQDAYDHGARIIVNCSVDHVLVSGGRASGVVAYVCDPQSEDVRAITVHAKAVVVAAGALHSPAVLLRSGLENPHIGKHLHLHPVAGISGIYPEKVYPWQGGMQTAYCDEFAQLTGNYGYILEVPPVHPGLLALCAPWVGARFYRERLLEAAYTASFIVLTRDRGEGSITLDSEGEPVVNYVTSVFERRHLLHGMRVAARAHLAAGAREVFSLHSKLTQLTREAGAEVSERQLREFDAQLERHGMGSNRLPLFSAHQMGTCRMGADPAQSATNEHGEVHGVKRLFVCDGSVFPAASGVNPMLTIMALAHRSAQYIKTVV